MNNNAKQPLRAIIIDDDDMIRSYLRIMLKDEGIESIEEAGSGEKARKLLKLRPARLILLDINLPDIDGVNFLKEILNSYPDSHVVMVSSETTLKRVKTAVANGAKGFIAKPFNAKTVYQQIKSLIEQAN